MYSFETTTPPTFAPVSSADLISYLHLNDSSEADLCTSLVAAASDLFTVTTNGHVLCSQTIRLRLDGWPATSSVVYVPRAPVSAVSLVEYLDTSAVWQTLTGWTSDTVSVPARVILPASLPSLHSTQRPAVRITFTAGYANVGAVPAGAALAVKLLAAYWFGNRTAFGEKADATPAGWAALAARFDTGYRTDWNHQ